MAKYLKSICSYRKCPTPGIDIYFMDNN